MSKDELDIPIWSILYRQKLGYCMECGKNKAKYLCDYHIGKTIDLYGKGLIEDSTCDLLLCEKCTNKIANKDYCKKHFNQVKGEINENRNQI